LNKKRFKKAEEAAEEEEEEEKNALVHVYKIKNTLLCLESMTAS